ncbi:MAG: proline racemase family protein [Cyclobacteriaceae bacterium]|jgi:proline racemase
MKSINDLELPSDWLCIKTIDMHTGGEPLRIILDGFPTPVGNSVIEYRNYFRTRQDHLRRALMYEPRGHADMYGVIITPSKVADFGVVFTHNEGYSTMCGHATIAITKLAVAARWVEVSEGETSMKIEAPCGLLTATAEVENNSVKSMKFENVPSFVVGLDFQLEIVGLGLLTFDIAYGGAYYAIVDADTIDLDLSMNNYQSIRKLGVVIKKSIIDSSIEIVHPIEEGLSFLYGVIFTTKNVEGVGHSRNVCVFADGEVDRSPTGSGVSARAAVNFTRGTQGVGETHTTESIVGSNFDCRIIREEDYFGINAVIPEVSGTAYITGKHQFVIDPDDPYKEGFFLC